MQIPFTCTHVSFVHIYVQFISRSSPVLDIVHSFLQWLVRRVLRLHSIARWGYPPLQPRLPNPHEQSISCCSERFRRVNQRSAVSKAGLVDGPARIFVWNIYIQSLVIGWWRQRKWKLRYQFLTAAIFDFSISLKSQKIIEIVPKAIKIHRQC